MEDIEKTKEYELLSKTPRDFVNATAIMVRELKIKNDYLEQHIVSLTERLAKIESQVQWNLQYCLSEIGPIKESLRYRKKD
jgi:hypothetical protein